MCVCVCVSAGGTKMYKRFILYVISAISIKPKKKSFKTDAENSNPWIDIKNNRLLEELQNRWRKSTHIHTHTHTRIYIQKDTTHIYTHIYIYVM